MTIIERLMKFAFFRRPKVTAEIITLETRISYLKSRNQYFQYHSSDESLFLPEFEISKEIIEVIEATDKTQEEKLNEIVAVYNKITQLDHYDGSGWFDFQLVLGGYFHHFSYSIDFDRETGLMSVQKDITSV